MKSIKIADYHIKGFDHKKPILSNWEQELYIYCNDKILEQIKKHKPYKVDFLGDIFDTIPKDRENFIFQDLITKIRNINLKDYKGSDILINCIDGNHTLIPNINKKVYYKSSLKEWYKNQYDINVYQYKEIDNTKTNNKELYCSHGEINKLATLSKEYDIVYSHFRSSDPKDKAIYSDEIDTEMLKLNSKLVILGDIHKRLNYDNIVYTGTPINVSFKANPEKCSILLVDEKTLKWTWLDTIEDNYNKKVLEFFEEDTKESIIEKLNLAKEDYQKTKSFYKIKITHTKSFIKSIPFREYAEFSFVEPNYVTTSTKDTDKEISSIIQESNISNTGVELDFDNYVKENNKRRDLDNTLVKVLNTLKGGIFND